MLAEGSIERLPLFGVPIQRTWWHFPLQGALGWKHRPTGTDSLCGVRRQERRKKTTWSGWPTWSSPSSYPLEGVPEALRRLGEGRALGRLVIEMG